MAVIEKILDFNSVDINRILRQGVYAVANDTERDAIVFAIKTTGRAVLVLSTAKFYVWEDNAWKELPIGGKVEIDKTTITINTKGQIQTIAITNGTDILGFEDINDALTIEYLD